MFYDLFTYLFHLLILILRFSCCSRYSDFLSSPIFAFLSPCLSLIPFSSSPFLLRFAFRPRISFSLRYLSLSSCFLSVFFIAKSKINPPSLIVFSFHRFLFFVILSPSLFFCLDIFLFLIFFSRLFFLSPLCLLFSNTVRFSVSCSHSLSVCHTRVRSRAYTHPIIFLLSLSFVLSYSPPFILSFRLSLCPLFHPLSLTSYLPLCPSLSLASTHFLCHSPLPTFFFILV